MLTYNLDFNSDTPLYLQLYNFIRSDIESGELSKNLRLPSRRKLAEHLSVSLITIDAAYQQLLLEGYIHSKEKKGYYVEDIPQLIKKEPVVMEDQEETVKTYRLDLTSNTPPLELFPFATWATLTRDTLRNDKAEIMKRCSYKGHPVLRRAIAGYLKEFSAINVSYNQIIIASGSDVIYDLLIKFLGADVVYGVEDPGYGAIRRILELNGAEYKLLPLDDKGVVLKEKVNVLHTSPAHQFPLGITMKIERRLSLLKQMSSGIIIEDDYDHEFRHVGKPLDSLYSLSNGQGVIYMNTFSKTVSPAFKIAFMIIPENLLKAYEEKMNCYSCGVSVIDQLVLAKFIEGGHYYRHLSRLRNYYRKLRNDLLDHLLDDGGFRVYEEDSGLHFLMECDEELSEDIKVHSVKDYGHNSLDERLVINYSSLKSEDIEYIKKGHPNG